MTSGPICRVGTLGRFQLGRDFHQRGDVPRLRAIALTCITAKNREQVGVIEFWGAQQPMVRCVSFLCSASESGVERVLCSPHPKLNPIRPITLDNGAHTRDIDIAIPFRLIWKTRPYIGQPWSSGRIPACQHKHGTRRRRIARALRSHVGYPRILENSWRRTSTTTRSRFSHEQYAGGTWTNPMSRVATRRSVRGAHKTRTRNVVLTETPRFDVKQTRVRFPVVATHSQYTWRLLFFSSRADGG